jgi:hypothetical protein
MPYLLSCDPHVKKPKLASEFGIEISIIGRRIPSALGIRPDPPATSCIVPLPRRKLPLHDCIASRGQDGPAAHVRARARLARMLPNDQQEQCPFTPKHTSSWIDMRAFELARQSTCRSWTEDGANSQAVSGVR